MRADDERSVRLPLRALIGEQIVAGPLGRGSDPLAEGGDGAGEQEEDERVD